MLEIEYYRLGTYGWIMDITPAAQARSDAHYDHKVILIYSQ